MHLDPDPLNGSFDRQQYNQGRSSARLSALGWGYVVHEPGEECDEYAEATNAAMNYGQGYAAGRSSFRWYLLASFVTGLLLGAAVARVVNP